MTKQDIYQLYQVRLIRADTSEWEPRYFIARHEEEAAVLFFTGHVEYMDPEDLGEVTVSLVRGSMFLPETNP